MERQKYNVKIVVNIFGVHFERRRICESLDGIAVIRYNPIFDSWKTKKRLQTQ